MFKETQIPKNELEQELAKLKESDPEFQELTQKIETLKAEQEQFARQIIHVQQTLSTLSDRIMHSLLAIDGMNRDIAAGNAVFFPRAMMYLDGMERRAKERLLKYHYWMAKALEYRTLESYDGELNLTSLFEQFATITSVNGELTLTDFEVLKALYTEQLSSIAEDILDDYNSNRGDGNEFSTVTYFSFEQDQELLDALNNNEAITLNFMKESLFPASREAIRLVKLEVDEMTVHLEGGDSVGYYGDLFLSMAHAGLSTLAKGGKVYQFTHYNEETENPIIWRTTYHALTGSLSQDEPSDARQSLLRSILTITDDDVMIFSRPAGWADIVFYKDVNTETGVDIVIDSLRLKVEYDYFDKPSQLVTLHVGAVEEGLRPLFMLNQPDNNGLQDGVGNFYRTYPKNSTVTIEAPPRYGLWKFEKWVDRYGDDLDTNRSLGVSLSDDQLVRAHFVEEAGAPEINVKQGDVDIAPESMYDFGHIAPGSKKTVTFTIENPGTESFSLYSIDLASRQFSVDPTEDLPLTIAPNGSTTFDITYEPDEAGLHAATVSIPNNELGTNPFLFTAASTDFMNLLCDPGFDESTNPGGFPNSGCWLPSWLGQAGSVVTGFARSGRYSLHVYTGNPGTDYFSRPYHTDVVYIQGKQYRAGAYIKTPAGFAWQPTSSAFIRLSYKDSNGSEITHYDSLHYLTANSEYELYEVTAPTVPPGTAYVGFAIFLQKPEGLSGRSIINVDDTFLQALDIPSDHISASDDTATTMENVPVTVAVLDNDSDEDGDELMIDSVTQGSYGTVVNTATDILYTPQQIFHGTDNFQYTVTDGNGNYAIAWVTVTVEADPNNLLCDNAFDQSTNPGEFPNSGCWLPSWLGTAGSEINEFYRSPPNSLHIYTGDPGTDYFSRPEHTDVTYTPGKQYRARAFIKTPAGYAWQANSSAFIRVFYKDSDGSGIAHYDSPPYTTANVNWELYEVTAPSAPPETAYVGFAIFLQKPEGVVGQSIINVDDCFLEALEQPPALEVEPELLDFGAVNANMTAKVTNIGGDILNWSITDLDYNWINVDPTSGSLLPGQSNHVTITIDRTGLKPGTEHTTTITVNAPDIEDTQDISVYMSVPRTVPTQPSIVTTNGTQLIVQKRLFNDQLGFPKAYTIKGFAWSPVSIDSVVDIAVRKQAIFDWHAYDLGMMKGANANTVYLYLDPGLDPSKYSQVLDTMYKNNIMAIMTVDEGINNVTNITEVVNAYKDHPAVLMWALGNEWNLNFYHGKYDTVQKAAEATEQAAQLIKTLDTNHPVAATYADISIAQTPSTNIVVNTICPSVDVWGLNIYRGYDFYDLFTEWAAITSKPMFLSEFGIDSFHTTDYAPDSIAGYIDEQKQADWNHSLWLDLSSELSADNSSKVCVGGTYFEWNDEWWKAGSPGVHSKGGWNSPAFPDAFSNEEYYGAVRIDENIRMPKLTYYTIKDDFWEENNPPTMQILQPDGIDDLENTSYTITWTDADLDDNASIALYYNTNNTDENGTLIVGSISEDDQTDAYIWDISQVPEGDYYVYAIIDDGVNPSVASYSSGPVTIVQPIIHHFLLWTR